MKSKIIFPQRRRGVMGNRMEERPAKMRGGGRDSGVLRKLMRQTDNSTRRRDQNAGKKIPFKENSNVFFMLNVLHCFEYSIVMYVLS